MAFTRERVVTVCQQLLVTAAVSTLALTAASVVTLDIVDPGGVQQRADIAGTAFAGAAAGSAGGVLAGARLGAR